MGRKVFLRKIMRSEIFSKKVSVNHKKAWTKSNPLVITCEIIMSLLLSVRKRLVLPAIFLAFPFFVSGQNTISPQGPEYAMTGALAGDQVNSSIALNQTGGVLVWEDNASDKSGSGISCARLNSSFTRVSSFPINKIAKGDQRNPQVKFLSSGDAIVVWQGNGLGNSDIYARILKGDGTFSTSDIRLNSYVKDQQSEPAVCALQDGSAFVAWQSFGQDGSMMGIYAAKVSASGVVSGNGTVAPTLATGTKKKGAVIVIKEFQINQATSYNQRTPAVATLTNGNVVVVWISEFERFGDPQLPGPSSVDVYGRLFDASGIALSDEILLNSGNNICGNPSVAALAGGGFTVAWSEKDSQSRSNGWEIMGRSFSAEGVASGADFKVNTNTYGDQYRPKITAVGNDCVVVWTSMGQDGSWEGVFGRLLQGGAAPSGDEFLANNTTVSKQIFPAIASNGANQFLISWSSFVGVTGFDLFARKYVFNQQP